MVAEAAHHECAATVVAPHESQIFLILLFGCDEFRRVIAVEAEIHLENVSGATRGQRSVEVDLALRALPLQCRTQSCAKHPQVPWIVRGSGLPLVALFCRTSD